MSVLHNQSIAARIPPGALQSIERKVIHFSHPSGGRAAINVVNMNGPSNVSPSIKDSSDDKLRLLEAQRGYCARLLWFGGSTLQTVA